MYVWILLSVIAVGFSLLLWRVLSNGEWIRWIRKNGYRVVSRERRFLSRGPFVLGIGRAKVYRFVIEDEAGRRRSGWIRFGDGWLTNRPFVEWDTPCGPEVGHQGKTGISQDE